MPRSAMFVAVFLACAVCAPTDTGAAKKTPPTTESPTGSAQTPKGFVRMEVVGVMPTEQGNAVILALKQEGLLLPIWIGNAEAFSIQMRLDRRRFQRPLTHDLLDSIMRELGGKLIKIQVDDLKGNTFVGTVFVRQGKNVIEVDSRPSDAIALAVGNRAPIYVSRKVLDRAGIREPKAPGSKAPGDGKAPAAEDLLKDILNSDREEHTL